MRNIREKSESIRNRNRSAKIQLTEERRKF